MSEDILRRGAKVDRYDIRELIGKGGMGEVYRAWDPSLERDVAVKVLTLRDEEMLRRFEREAHLIGRLDNHHVVEIHDLSLEGEHPYIVMEYLKGENLRDRLKRGQMEVAEAVEVVLGVCCGVSACHRVGIIHRDVKPANVFLCESPHYGTVVKVLDFGVAKPAIYATDDLTAPGKVTGTPRYMAPEQIRGQQADELSDQYSIALLLCACLTGQRPFGKMKDTKELAWAILRSEYPRPRERRPEIPEGLETVTLQAMSADRRSRYSSVVQFAQALIPYAPPECQDIWGESFANEPTDDAKTISGEVTEVEAPLPERETAPTEVVGPEKLALLARQSLEESAALVARTPGDSPERLILKPRVVVPMKHLETTRIDSSPLSGPVMNEPKVEAGLPQRETAPTQVVDPQEVAELARQSVDKTARPICPPTAGVIETNQRRKISHPIPPQESQRRGARGGRLRSTVVPALGVILGAALVLILATVLGAKHNPAVFNPGSPPLLLHAGPILDAGGAGVAGPTLEGRGTAAVVEGSAAANERPPKRHRRKRQVRNELHVEYTKDGSPILY